jgi:hypothetical protein
VVTFWGDTTDRFGLDLFFHAMITLGSLPDAPANLVIEIPISPTNRAAREALRRFILYSRRIKFRMVFCDRPTGVLILPYRYDYALEAHWRAAGATWDLPMIEECDPELLAYAVLKVLGPAP